jgi:hypothetical protein
MKRFFLCALAVILFASASAFSQSTTPNLGLNKLYLHQPDWHIPLNDNADKIDAALFGGTIKPKCIGNLCFADQYAGVDTCAKITAALVALPATGGIVDARGFQGTQACSANPFSGISKSATVLLGNATFQTIASWVIPNKVSVHGSGRGDSGGNNTSIQAVSGFPATTPVIAFGTSAPSFGIHVENLQVDCNNQTGAIGVQNVNSQEQTGLRHVTILDCPNIGLDIETSGAQNSGPYEDLEILNQSGGSAGTLPVVINQVPAFRGLHGATINALGAAAVPTVAIRLDSSGTISDIHCEHTGDCVRVGSIAATSSAVVTNVNCGPSSTNCVHISNSFANQNIALSGITTSAGNAVVDDILSTTLTDSSVGLYVLGNGSGTAKTRLTDSANAPLLSQGLRIPQTNNDLVISGTPSAGQAPIATGPTAASWGNILATTGYASSKAQPGYLKLPDSLGGFILQWSSGSPTGSTVNVAFPLSFPHACLSVFGSTKTGTQTFSVDISGSNWAITGNGTYWLLAIGY